MEGAATLVDGSLVRGDGLAESHVGEVGLSTGQKGFMWVFVVTDHLQLADNISL